MTIKNNFNDFLDGSLPKEDYIAKQYEDSHSKLFEYSKYLESTDIKEIKIIDGEVILTTRAHGLSFICPELDFRSSAIETLNFKDYEKDCSQMMVNLINDGDTIFDVGTNMGWYSILFSALNRNSDIHSFEPVPKTFSAYLKNIQLNNSLNITANHFGLSDAERDEYIYFYPQGSGNASLQNLSESQEVEKIPCKFKTLDQYTSDNNCSVDFLKCDVEGAELLVFKGGKETILKHKPIIFSEILRKWSKKFEYNPNDIFDLFRSMGYEGYFCQDGKLFQFAEMNESTVETNFFFLHLDKHASRIDQFS